MKNCRFSAGERTVVDFILEKGEDIRGLSTKQIGEATYTSPSILSRIAKKLGYKGWNDLKEAYLDEIVYLQSHFQNIDPNFPFDNHDSFTEIVNKIAELHTESIQDTLLLYSREELDKALQYLRRAEKIQIFTIGNLNYLGQNFVFKLRKIGRNAYIDPVQDNMYQDAYMMNNHDCAIVISYSGETPNMLRAVCYLKQNNVPIIAITSIGSNRLSKAADAVLNITTRETSHTKIGPFTSEASISLVLDYLYACLFAMNYRTNMEYKMQASDGVETGRKIDNAIVQNIE